MKIEIVGKEVLSRDRESTVSMAFVRFDKVRVFEAKDKAENKEMPFSEHKYGISVGRKIGNQWHNEGIWLLPEQLKALKTLLDRMNSTGNSQVQAASELQVEEVLI